MLFYKEKGFCARLLVEGNWGLGVLLVGEAESRESRATSGSV